MDVDIRQKFKILANKLSGTRKMGRRTGYTVSLQDGEHRIANYSTSNNRIILTGEKTVTTEELKELSADAKSLVVCFSPRSIYADLGDFSSVTAEATLAHIRSTVDKTGLFNEQYSLSFRKVYDIDNVRARYSYLAIPASEVSRVSILDDREVFLDSYCPIEASITSLIGRHTKDMAIAVFEDGNAIRIIGSKAGIIYHLITIQKQNAFDLSAETIAGISEMSSLMKNTYNDPPRCIFKIGNGEANVQELQENGIDACPFDNDEIASNDISFLELLGNVSCADYSFVPKAFRETRTLSGFSRFSMGISLAMVVFSALFFFLGYRNASEAKNYEVKARAAQQGYERDMSILEQEYGKLLKKLDLTHINELIGLYQDFRSEPKLYTILGTITQAVPNDMTLKSVTVLRSGINPETPEEGAQQTAEQMPPTTNPSFRVKVEGVITAQYPQSKILFSTFLSGIQVSYPVVAASFKHDEEGAVYTVECEAKK